MGNVSEPMSFTCPNCQTVLFNRARRDCGTCGAILPAELLLPESQIRYREEQLARERKSKAEANVTANLEGFNAPID